MFHQFILIYDQLRFINPRIFLLAALLLTALNPLSAQVITSGVVNPYPTYSPTWNVGQTLYVGDNSDGTLTIGPNGTVTNTFGIVGSSTNTIGNVNVFGGSWTNSNDLYLGYYGTGTLIIGANGLVTSNSGVVGYNSGSIGSVTVSPGTWYNVNDLFIGYNGTGSLTLGTGGTATNKFGFVGYNSGSIGTVNVFGGTWINYNSDLFIGHTGTGTLTIGTNGTVTNKFGYVGYNSSSNGTVNVSGGTWTNSSSLNIGSGGTGTLNVNAGTVSSSSTTLGQSLSGTGTLNLNGGELTTGQLSKGSGNGTVTFNGGTLRLSGHQSNLFNGFEAGDVTLAAGGGTIDTQNLNVATTYELSGSGGLTKTGTGTLTLTGNNTYTGGTTISSGTLQIGGGTTGSVQGDILNNSILSFNCSNTLTFGGVISGAGQLKQLGAGTLILTGANTYTGGTTISSGTLQIGDGGTTGSLQGDILNNSILSFNRSNTLTFGDVISGSGQLKQLGAGTLILTGANTYTGGTTISGGTLQIGDGGTTGSLQGDILNNSILSFNRSDNVIFSGNTIGSGQLIKLGPGTLILTGYNSHNGGITISGGTLQIGNGGTSGSVQGNINILNNSILSFNRSDNVIFSGNTIGAGQLIKLGPGTLILTGANTYTGGTTISSGILQIGNGGTSGSVQGDILNNSILRFNRSDMFTFNDVISGMGQLIKLGPGTLILTGANTYTGGTTINGGTLLLTGAGTIGTGNLTMGGGTLDVSGITAPSFTLADDIMLSGSGTIIATGKTLQVDGTLSPGNSPGTLTINGDLTLSSTAVSNFEINGTAPGLFDRIDGVNSMTFGGTLNLTTGYAPALGDSVQLFSASTYSGTFSSITGTNLGGGLSWIFDAANGTITVIPEPSTWVMLVGGLVALILLRRRCRNQA
jgi:autotransporter-associated beta strand protein/T5SS/PEP-CTERM-associated repeat protein